jgi:hypothetical protein
MTEHIDGRQVVADGRGVEEAQQAPPKPGPEHKRLDIFIGNWITEGTTIKAEGARSLAIRASDVYEWIPSGFFVLHTAYGRIGEVDVGGTEIIGYDAARGKYRSHFFDSFGNVTTQDLTFGDGAWTWQGVTTRATAVFSDDGKTQTAHHERTDDGATWLPSMEVTLTNID